MLLLLGAKVEQRERPDRGVRAVGRGKARVTRQVLGDEHAGRLVDLEPAVFDGDVDAQEADLGGLQEQLAHQLVVAVLHLFDAGVHLALHEVARGLGEHLLLVVEVLRDQQRLTAHLLKKEGATGGGFAFLCHRIGPCSVWAEAVVGGCLFSEVSPA